MIDLSGVVLGFADTTLAVSRPVVAWGVDGRPTSTSSSLPVFAMVVPAKTRRSAESQGVAQYGAVDIYSVIRLMPSDTFSLDGHNYQVESVDSYSPTGGFAVARAVVVP